jgi:hypothetical protein
MRTVELASFKVNWDQIKGESKQKTNTEDSITQTKKLSKRRVFEQTSQIEVLSHKKLL